MSSGSTAREHLWKLNAPIGIRTLGIGIAAVNFVFIVVLLFWTETGNLLAFILTIVTMAIFGAFGIVLARSYIYLRIDEQQFEAGLWPLSKHFFALQDVQDVSYVKDVRPSTFGGVGIGKVPGNSVGYLWGGGPAVEARSVSGQRVTVVFDQADQAAQVLHKVIDRS